MVSKSPFVTLLRDLSLKGVYPVLQFIDKHDDSHYSEIVQYALKEKLIESRSQVDVILRSLTELKLLQRSVRNERPVRTTYSLTKKGKAILHHLGQIEKEASS